MTRVVFKGTVSDPDGDRVRLGIELRQITEAFTGASTWESSLVASGTEVSWTSGNLVNASYKWRYRAVDERGQASEWTEFGATGNADFVVSVDTDAPMVTDFTVNTTSVNLGGSFTFNYSVSDSGGSGLKQAELWRSTDGVNFSPVPGKVNTHSGNSASGTFTDAPSAAGTYWYGMHVVDNAGNCGVNPYQKYLNGCSLLRPMVKARLKRAISKKLGIGISVLGLPFLVGGSPLDMDLPRLEQTLRPKDERIQSLDYSQSLESRVEEFPIVLSSGDQSKQIHGAIRRTISQEALPFRLVYELSIEGDSHFDLTGIIYKEIHTLVLPEVAFPEWDPNDVAGHFSNPEVSPLLIRRPTPSSIEFVVYSNFYSYKVELQVNSGSGLTYYWHDEGVDFPLHNRTSITLDATKFMGSEQISQAFWEINNGDASDAITFPISNPISTITSFNSQWPNVLNIEATLQLRDGSTEKHTMEAILYFREGTPFQFRGLQTGFTHEWLPASDRELALAELYALLPRLGYNMVNYQVGWYHGLADPRGNFVLTPIYQAQKERFTDPQGRTISDLGFPYTVRDDLLKDWLDVAKQRGFVSLVELRQWSLPFYPIEMFSGRTIISPGFFYGDGRGYENMLQYYLPLLIEGEADIVFLGAESGHIETLGGSLARNFYSNLIREYREAGYVGKVSYASNYVSYEGREIPMPLEHIYFPSMVGIPWKDMDFIGLTFYPMLAKNDDATTEEMYNEAMRQVRTYLQPLSMANNKPIFIEDFYGSAYDGMARNPLRGDGKYDPEEQRRWTTAWLRAFSTANQDRENPIIVGVSFGTYEIVPNRYMAAVWPIELTIFSSNLNVGAKRPDLQKLIMAYFRDVPLKP